MKAIVLPGLFLILVIFGYLTVGRWLQRTCFSLPQRPPTDEEREDISPLVALAGHAGTVPGLITMVSILIAVHWGWAPAFVWILLGTTIGGLVYFLGNRYWSNFIAPSAPLKQYEETGRPAVKAGHWLILVTLLTTASMMITLSALLMPGHPGLVFALAMAFPAWLCFRNSYLAPGPLSQGRLAWGLLSALCLVTGILLGNNISLTIIVDWQPAPGLFPGFVVTEGLVWAVLILIGIVGVGRQSAGSPSEATTHLNIFSGLLLLVLIVLLALSLLTGNPELTLPARSTDDSAPSFFWLGLIIFAGGLMSASRGIVSLERRYLEGGEPRHAVHFAGFAADGLFALLVLTAIATTTGADNGMLQLSHWPDQIDIGQLLRLGSVSLTTVVGTGVIPVSVAEIFVLFVLQLTALSFLVNILPLSSRMLEHADMSSLIPENVRGSAITVAIVILTGLFVLGGPGAGSWLLLGILNALTVGIMMLYVDWTLVRNEQPVVPVLVISTLILILAIFQAGYAVTDWLAAGRWTAGIIAILLLIAVAIPMFSLLRLIIPTLGQGRSSLDLFDRE